MSNKIRKEDLFEDNLFPTKEAEQYATQVDAIVLAQEKLIRQKMESAQAISFSDSKNSKNIADFIRLEKEANVAISQHTKALQEQEKLKQQSIKTEREKLKLTKDQAKDQDRANKISDRQAKAAQEAERAYVKLNKQLLEQKKAVKDLLASDKELSDADKQLIKDTQELDAKLKQIDKTVGDHQREVGNYEKALGILPQRFQGAIQGVKAFGTNLSNLAKNKAILIITTIAAALTGLGAAFKTTDEGAVFFDGIMKSISNILGVVVQRIAAFASGLKSFLSGDFSEGLEKMKESFKGMGDQISAAADAGFEYAKALDAVQDAENDFISQRAINANKIAKLEFIAADTGQLAEKRIAALKLLLSISKEQAAEEEKIAQRRYAVELEQLAKLKGIDKQRLAQSIESAESLSDVAAKLADDEIENLETLFAKTKETNTALFEETKKANARLSALINEIDQAILKQYDELFGELKEKYKNDSKEFIENEKKKFEASVKRNEENIKLILENDELEASLTKSKIDDENARFQTELNNFKIQRDELGNITEQSQRHLELIEKKHQKNLTDITIEEAKERQKELNRIEEELFNAFERGIEIKQERNNEAIDAEIAARERSIETQQRLAEKGAENILAFEQEQLAKAQLAKKQEAERQRRQDEAIKLAELFLNSLNGKLDKGDSYLKAAGEALAETFAAKGLASIVAGSAYEGVEDTGDAGDADSKGGKLWVLHPNERVLTKEQNKMIGGMSNDDLANLAFQSRMGDMQINDFGQNMSNSIMIHQLVSMNKGVKELNDIIKNKPVQQVAVDSFGNIIETMHKNSEKIVTVFMNKNRRKQL